MQAVHGRVSASQLRRGDGRVTHQSQSKSCRANMQVREPSDLKSQSMMPVNLSGVASHYRDGVLEYETCSHQAQDLRWFLQPNLERG